MAISALFTAETTGDMLDRMLTSFAPAAPEEELAPSEEDEGNQMFSVALVGRPNVGKSTLFNRLIGEDRSVVHDMAGTTRDSVDTIVETEHGPVKFVDTAGMRQRAELRMVPSTSRWFVRCNQSIPRTLRCW